jgi:hypothetical protein
MKFKLINNKGRCLTLILFFSLMASSSFSQNWQWFTSAGGDKSDKGLDIDMDRFGNLYVSGYYNNSSSGNVMFSSLTAPVDFGKDAFVAKIDSTGNWVWLQPGQGGWDERALGMCVDRINNFVYVTGTCWYNTNFGSCPTPTSYPGGQDNIFISKLDLNGNCQWLIQAGSASDDHGYDLVTDKAGNIYLTGFASFDTWSTNDTAYFGDHKFRVPYGDSLGYVTKISPSGVFQWVRAFPGIDGERDNRITIDDEANIYVTGSFYGTQAYGTTTVTSKGGHDIFVLKLDSAGNQLWVQTAGGILNDRGNSVTVDGAQDVYVTGEFRDIVIFGPDTVNNYGGPSGRDAFVAKLTKNGNWKWASKAGSSSGSDRGNRIESDKRDLLFITGQIKGNATFGSKNVVCNPMDSIQAFVAALDTAGVWHWVTQGGGHYEDRGNGLVVDEFCNIYVAGYFQDTVTFGALTDTSVYKKDIFVSKINSDCNVFGIGIHENLLESNMVLFPNPSNGKFTIDFGTYFKEMNVIVYNAFGQELQDHKLNGVDRAEITIKEGSGIYFVKLIGSNGAFRTFKVVSD